MCRLCELARASDEASGSSALSLSERVEAEGCPVLAQRVPVVIVTGFLGSGKTTLLNRLLGAHAGRLRLAVIENEVGAEGVDDKLLADKSSLGACEVVLMPDGCLCCRVRGDLVDALKRVLARAQADAVVIELSGLSSLAPVVQTFFASPWVQRRLRLDCVLCVVDCGQARRLGQAACAEAVLMREQLALADLVLVTKADRHGAAEAARAAALVRLVNATCAIHACALRDEEDELPAGLAGEQFTHMARFSLESAAKLSQVLREEGAKSETHAHAHGHAHDNEHQRALEHAPAPAPEHAHVSLGFSSLCVVERGGPIDVRRLRAWLQEAILKQCPDAVVRFKAVLWVAPQHRGGHHEEWVGHGVYGQLELLRRRAVFADEPDKRSVLVFIGPIDDEARFGRLRERLARGVAYCVASPEGGDTPCVPAPGAAATGLAATRVLVLSRSSSFDNY
jgi:G3E family GTPase